MTRQIIDLNRSFVELESSEWDDNAERMAHALKKLRSWDDVLSNRASLVVASANAGKTTELRRRAAQLRHGGAAACFVAVRELDAASSVFEGMEEEEAIALRAWLGGPEAPIYLFVDSIDEAALAHARDLRKALQKIAREVAPRASQVHWVLSTRPAALNQEVVDAITLALGIGFPALTAAVPVEHFLNGENTTVSVSPVPTSPAISAAVVIYRMAALSYSQAVLYLEKRHGISNASAVIAAAERHGMSSLLLTPGKLNLLQELDLVRRPPGTLLSVFETCVTLQISEPAGDRSEIANVTKAQLNEEVLRVACASTLCDRLNISIPAEDELVAPSALSARAIVTTMRDSGLRYLLSSSLFEDSGHHQSKLQPDDLRFFLTAQRLNKLIKSSSDAEKIARILCWKADTGETGAFGPFIPVAGWLSSLNPFFFSECLRIDPQCVAFFGDLRSLAPSDARKALTSGIEKIAEGERLGHGSYTLTSENYWQAGPEHLGPLILKLFDRFSDSPPVRDVLLDIARHARLPVLLNRLLELAEDKYSNILKDEDHLTYFLAVGTDAQLDALRDAALATTELNERVTRKVLRAFAWTRLDANGVTRVVRNCNAQDDEKFWLKYSLTEEIGPLASTSQLLKLCGTLFELFKRQLPSVTEPTWNSRFREYQWLGETVVNLLGGLQTRRLNERQVAVAAEMVVQVKTHIVDHSYGLIDMAPLRESMAAPGPLRMSVIQTLLHRAGTDESAVWGAFVFGEPLVTPTLDEAQSIDSRLLLKVLDELRARRASGRKEVPKEKRNSIQSRTRTKKALTARIPAIQAGADASAFYWFAQVLAGDSGRSRYGDVSVEAFRSKYGDQLTDAFLQGLTKYWRTTSPQRDEDKPNSTYWSTIAGLQAVHLELNENEDAIADLQDDEVARALDYGLYELNGLPTWYWSVVQMHASVAHDFLTTVLSSADIGAVSHERAMKLLTVLSEAPTSTKRALSQTVWGVVKNSTELDSYALERALALVTTAAGVSRKEFSNEARRRCQPDLADKNCAVWAANWLLYVPEDFLTLLRTVTDESRPALNTLVMGLAAYLEEERTLNFSELAADNPALITAVMELYLSLREALPSAKAPVRKSFKVYRMDDSARARRLRDKLPGLIASVSNTASYEALKTLEGGSPDTPHRHWMRFLMRRVAENMRKVPPMSAAAYLEFERRLHRESGTEEAFAQEIENDLDEVKDVVENGDFSPRRFLATFVHELPAAVIQSMEDEFQLFLAGQLDLLGRHRYNVVREEQLSEDTRRDISVLNSAGGWKATLELKVSLGKWTLADYRDSLRNQLVGRYMKQRHTNVGFFVVLLQKPRSWKGPSGRDITFDQLIQILRDDAHAIQAETPRLRLRVVGIDATEPTAKDGLPLRQKARRSPSKGSR